MRAPRPPLLTAERLFAVKRPPTAERLTMAGRLFAVKRPPTAERLTMAGRLFAAAMSPTPPYVELHAHSAYSFGSGASLPEELVERAQQLGHVALALTDHDSLSGAMEHAIAARTACIDAIHGAEVTIAPSRSGGGSGSNRPRHLTLLVEDLAGWRNLCRLLTHAHSHTRERRDRRQTQPSVTIEQVCEHAGGLICLTGCASDGVDDERTAQRLLEAFGLDRLRVELQRPYLRGDGARNAMLTRLARRLCVPTVATGGVHAHTPARAQLQDALVALKHGVTLDGSEALRRGNHSHVLARPEAMAARFAEHAHAVAETLELAQRLAFRLTGDLGYRYPRADDDSADHELAEVCAARLERHYPHRHPRRSEARARLEQELDTIRTLSLSGFFLLHHEILELAQQVAAEVRGPDTPRALLPPGRGRGSSVSSIVCYLTGLSHIDPIENELAIGRFLHEDITGLPDIDIDFPRDVRERLIPAIHDRYGRDRTALVAAFPTYRSRGAIRDLGKVLGLPPSEIERVARASEGFGGGRAVARDVEVALGGGRLTGRWAWLARLAEEAHRLPRGISQHSGGMVLSTQPLIDCCPIVPAAMEERQIVQWDKDSCSDAGMLKIDLLGLGMLSAVERCVELIAERQQQAIDLSRIPFDDAETFAAIRAAETTGVFQIESRAQMGSLLRTRPQSLADLTIQVALVRPGPIVGGSVSPYIARRQRLARDPDYEIPHLHPSLVEPLADTLGTIIFQDQVIEVARAFAGFSAGEAESLRRAMSRKRSEEAMGAHRERFVEGALTTHDDVDPALAERVWEMVAGFAGFGFPKAHGAAFGLLAYQSTWLRVHHPAEFLCSLLNEQPLGFYPPDSLIHEAQRRGLTVLPPDVNASEAECTVIDGETVQIGLSYVKGVEREEVERLLTARRERGAFDSLEQLAATSRGSEATLELLAWAGACDELAGGGRRARRNALWQLGLAARSHRREQGPAQLALELALPRAPRLRPLSDWEALLADYASSGVAIERHPISLLRPQLEARGALSTGALSVVPHGDDVAVGGLVIARQRPQTANGVVFLLLEDEDGTLNVIVPERLYEAERLAVRTEPLLLVAGRLERHADGGGAINLLARSVGQLSPELADPAHGGGSVSDLDRRRTAAIAARGKGTVLPADSEASEAGSPAEDLKAIVPAVQHFAQGRRR